MKELTFGELKQGLICCTVYRDCKGCPLFDEDNMQAANAGDITCSQQLMAAAMNCINVMEKDLAAMTKMASDWEEQCTMRENELFELRESLDSRGKA
jgi:hypothetical protein